MTVADITMLDVEQLEHPHEYAAVAGLVGECANMERPLYGARQWHLRDLRHWSVAEARE